MWTGNIQIYIIILGWTRTRGKVENDAETRRKNYVQIEYETTPKGGY